MAAAHHELDNLVAIIDHNALQITGRTRDVMSNEPLDDKWRAFGWQVRRVDGHDYAALTTALTAPAGAPLCVIADTIKGKSLSVGVASLCVLQLYSIVAVINFVWFS